MTRNTTIENIQVQAVTETDTTTLEAVVPEANNNGQKVSVDTLQAPYVEITSLNDTTQVDLQDKGTDKTENQEDSDSQDKEVTDKNIASVELDFDSREVVEDEVKEEEEISSEQSSLDITSDISTQDVIIDSKLVAKDKATNGTTSLQGVIVAKEDIPFAVLNKDGTIKSNPEKFKDANWKKENLRWDSPLHELEELGWEIYKESNGDISYSIDGNQFTRETKGKFLDVVSGVLDREITYKYKSRLEKGELPRNNIEPNELKLVVGKPFKPHVKSTYYKKNGQWYRNKFMPTSYMELEGKPENDTPTINKVLMNLTQHKKDRFTYLMNWLAYMFKLLIKPQTAIIMIGDQGTGKGVLWSMLVLLFGRNQTFLINDKTLKGNFLQTVFDGKLFVFLDEISQGTSNNNKEIKNFVKSIITGERMALEKKYENTSEETELHACVFIASNELKSFEIEGTDRRFTVFKPNDVLTKINFFGFGDYKKMWAAIESEMDDFAKTLKNFEVDENLANVPMHTKEKDSLREATSDKLTTFTNAICDKDLTVFYDLEHNEQGFIKSYFDQLKENFERGFVSKKRLKHYYQYFSGTSISTLVLLRELKVRRPDIFDNEDRMTTSSKDGGDIRFHLDPDYTKVQKEVQKVEPYVQPCPTRATSNPVWPKPPVMDESKRVTQVPPLQNTKVS